MSALRAMVGAAQVEDVITLAGDEAMVAVLGKLSTFEGRSRFTTWAYKFAVLQAAVELRRQAWSHREVPLDAAPPLVEVRPTPDQYAEGAELATVVRGAIDHVLTPHQRRIALALIVDEVPIDVLAERLGTNRNSLYKTLHDARSRLRAHLAPRGLPDAFSGRDPMTAADRPLSTDALSQLTTAPGPWLSCDDCFRLVDRYVEALLSDGDATAVELAAMPAHLSCCAACAEEATTLLLLAAGDGGVDPADALSRLTAG
jgi:RNA polymerase sigma-70 factor (ECF subfamily)